MTTKRHPIIVHFITFPRTCFKCKFQGFLNRRDFKIRIIMAAETRNKPVFVSALNVIKVKIMNPDIVN